ncbi:hypothetical protein SLEP1_g33003 [Rubroshorea leprosula]|uniref:Aminotransferase-like plant mobile domain-containing protein n=1 Tax=Rubroshorea leprosula TaxID=152421 RepID=A0AAV5KF82_9ROSI|nr:hypothetical protein SLEP1_g33003 [Rubroshorea leprosula]
MAHDREGQSMPTGSASMAGPKAIHCLISPPPNLVKLFRDQNLQDDMNRILQKQKPCHSNQTFVPHKKSQILGPSFVSHPPASLASIYPQPKGHLLPFQTGINGLALLIHHGQASFSSLTGLPCTGEEISASKPVSADEHISFLLTLICKYIVCSAGKGPTKEFIPLAAALAYGRQMALGPFLLAHLYRSCQDIAAHPLVISGGPLWVLQLWLYSYFPALASVSSAVPARDLLTYGFMFKNAVENKKSFEECFQFFASLFVDQPDADFAVFLGRSHSPSWYRADIRSPDFRAFWSVCVTSRDLPVGCSLNTLNSRCGMELYALNQFCRQLGYCQDIPFPPLFSFNYSYPLRFIIGDSKILVTKLVDISKTLQTLILPNPPFRPSCTSSYKSWWRDYFHPRFLDVMANISALTPPQLTKKSEEKKVVKENEDLESAMAAQISQPNLPRRAPKLQIPPNKIEDVSPKLDQVEENIAASDEGDSATIPTKSLRNLATVLLQPQRPNELIDLSPDKENTPTPVVSPDRHVHVDDIESVAADVPMVDDDLENELLAQLDMLMNTPAKSRSATDSKGKAIAEEVDFDINLPTQEQISFAIMTMQELLHGDPSHFCKVPDQPAAFEAAQILSRAPQLSSTQQKFWADFTTIYTHFSRKLRVLESKVAAAKSVKKSIANSTATVFKKKEKFMAAKEAHITQVKHVQGLKEDISNLEAKLLELKNQVPLAEQSEKNLAEQRNKLCMDMEAGLKSTAKIKEQLPSFTASADEAVEEIKNMREEWSSWQNNLC